MDRSWGSTLGAQKRNTRVAAVSQMAGALGQRLGSARVDSDPTLLESLDHTPAARKDPPTRDRQHRIPRHSLGLQRFSPEKGDKAVDGRHEADGTVKVVKPFTGCPSHGLTPYMRRVLEQASGDAERGYADPVQVGVHRRRPFRPLLPALGRVRHSERANQASAA